MREFLVALNASFTSIIEKGLLPGSTCDIYSLYIFDRYDEHSQWKKLFLNTRFFNLALQLKFSIIVIKIATKLFKSV